MDERKTILITGGTGFAGSHLVELLVSQTSDDIHVTSFSDKKSFVHTLLPANNIHGVDLSKQEEVFELFEKIKPQEIYHLAAISYVGKSFAEASKIINNNTSLQLNVLEAAKEIVPKARILVIGSAQEYDLISHPAFENGISENHALGPANPYGVSKVSQDLLALSYHYAYDLKVVRVRPFNHIGERQLPGFVVSDFARQIARIEKFQQKKLVVGNLEAVRDFSDVRDIVSGYQLLMQKGKVGEVYNLGSGRGKSIVQILEILKSLATEEIEVEVDENKMRPLDVKEIIANTNKIQQLGYRAKYSLEETLERVLNYWRNA